MTILWFCYYNFTTKSSPDPQSKPGRLVHGKVRPVDESAVLRDILTDEVMSAISLYDETLFEVRGLAYFFKILSETKAFKVDKFQPGGFKVSRVFSPHDLLYGAINTLMDP